MNDVSAKIRDVNLAEVVAGAGVVLKNGGGGRLTGLCPLHGEKTPSFTVYADKNSFYCFGCGAGGDAAEFLMKLHNIEFPEALRRLGIDSDGKKTPRAPMRVPSVKKKHPFGYVGRSGGLRPATGFVGRKGNQVFKVVP